MNGQAGDFITDWQALAQQSWDAWTRQLQPPATTMPFSGNDTVDRALSGLKGYFDWMQGFAASGASQPGGDWQSLLKTWTGAGNQPFTQAFNGIDNAAAQGFVQQWQAWLKSAQVSGFAMPNANAGPMPSFGLNREQMMEQQEFAAAIAAAMQANATYQELIQRANTQGLERLQAKLIQRDASSPPLDSVKALYDLWVDAAEDAYAEVALSAEFRAAYGDMVNTQMRVRQLQQKQTSALCRELGLPTREEVSALGERLQQLRRERGRQADTGNTAEEVLALRREVNALKRELAGRGAAPVRKAAPKPVARVAAAKAKPVAKPKPKPAPKRAASAKKTPTRRGSKPAASRRSSKR